MTKSFPYVVEDFKQFPSFYPETTQCVWCYLKFDTLFLTFLSEVGRMDRIKSVILLTKDI